MKNRCAHGAITCVGAVVGAGFASGREVMAFFTRYGAHSWWLILLSTVASTAFCALCMRAARRGGTGDWYALCRSDSAVWRAASRLCGALLAAVVGGAMVSAAGHMVELLWPSQWAYPIGALGTLLIAWRLGFGTLKPLCAVSWALTAAMLAALLAALRLEPTGAVAIAAPVGAWTLLDAAIRAVGYAAMNITIAISVVCGCAGRDERSSCRASALFGLTLTALLFVSNLLYLRHPEAAGAAFPIVRLMNAFGRPGYIGCALLLYLAILTTLVALARSLRCAAEGCGLGRAASAVMTLGVMAGLSLVGFERIVGDLYAPTGLLCVPLVLWPLSRCKSAVPSS